MGQAGGEGLRHPSWPRARASSAISSPAREVEPDKQGRILIPQSLREHAGLEKDVTVIGAAVRAEIWDTARWNAYNESQTDEAIEASMNCWTFNKGRDAMEFHHKPVLFEETIQSLAIRPEGLYIDGTMGGGGHSEAIVKQLTTGRLLSIDQDPDAMRAAGERLGKYPQSVRVRGNFAQMGSLPGPRAWTRWTGCSWTSGCPPTSWIRRSGAFPTTTDAPLGYAHEPGGPHSPGPGEHLEPAGAGGTSSSAMARTKAPRRSPRALSRPGRRRPLRPPLSWRKSSRRRSRRRCAGQRAIPPGGPSRPCGLP